MATKTTSKKTSASKAKSSGTKKSTAKSTTSRKQTKSSSSSRKAQGFEMPIIRRAKSTSWLAILESLIVGALGVMFLIDSDGVKKTIFYIVGIFLIIKGVYKIINFFAVRGKYDFYNNDLLYGIIALVFGIIAVVLWESLGKVISVVVGAWIIYGALVRLNTAIKMRSMGVQEWFYVLLFSLIMMALGIYMVVSVNALPVLIGWVMILASAIGIVDDIFFIRNLDLITK